MTIVPYNLSPSELCQLMNSQEFDVASAEQMSLYAAESMNVSGAESNRLVE